MFDPTGRLFPPKIHRRADEEKKAAGCLRAPDGLNGVDSFDPGRRNGDA